MKSAKAVILFFLMIACSIPLYSCWNYQDIEKLAIVAGFAIDKNSEDNKYVITVELVDFEMSGKDTKQTGKYVEATGKTVFDAVRNIIDFSGKKLYWAHANVVIIGQDLAEEGIAAPIDLIFRDAEMREEMYIFISREKTAGDILKQQSLLSQTSSDNIENIFTGQSRVGNSYPVQIYELIDNLEEEGISVTLPCLSLKENLDKTPVHPDGIAIFRSDKLVGFLEPEETKYFLFTTNKFKKGVLTLKKHSSNEESNISFEINKTSTRVKPEISKGKLTVNVNIKQEAALAEIGTQTDYISKHNRSAIKKEGEENLEKAIETLIKKVQNDFDTDIFGFGKIIKAEMPSVWKNAQNKKINLFHDLKPEVKVELSIKNNALGSKVIKKGD